MIYFLFFSLQYVATFWIFKNKKVIQSQKMAKKCLKNSTFLVPLLPTLEFLQIFKSIFFTYIILHHIRLADLILKLKFDEIIKSRYHIHLYSFVLKVHKTHNLFL